MKKLCVVLLMLSLSGVVNAQIPTDSLQYRILPDSLKAGEVHLSLQNFNYLRNYEYFNRIQDGYTLFGGQLEPQLVFYPNKQLSLSAGVHLRKDFGGRGLYRTYPLFSLRYQKGNTLLINGVLDGTIHHRMIEPLFDLEKRITEPVEYGTQFIINKKSFFLDAFIIWKRMIYKPSPKQEQILGGASADIGLISGGRAKFSIPLQFTAFHQGGQIDTIHTPLQTFVNSAAGLKLTISTNGFIEGIRSENYYTFYNDLSFTSTQPFLNGGGVYLNNGIETRIGALMASYWQGNGYFSPAGMPLFQSVSQHINHTGYTQKHRQLLFLRYYFQKKLVSNLYLDFRFEPFIDLNRPGSKRIEFSNSTFLVYRQDFRLYRIKK